MLCLQGTSFRAIGGHFQGKLILILIKTTIFYFKYFSTFHMLIGNRYYLRLRNSLSHSTLYVCEYCQFAKPVYAMSVSYKAM